MALKTNTSFDISAVFKNGLFVVIQGGPLPFFNHHSISHPQKYAADIIKISSTFLSSRFSFFASDNQNYVSFKQPLYSPCDGSVKEVVKNLPNNSKNISEENLSGNKIILACKDNIDVKLSHFNPGSIRLDQGVNVKTGDYLGDIGNSGNSTEPHLHIQANSSFTGEPVPLTYRGVGLIRNLLLW